MHRLPSYLPAGINIFASSRFSYYFPAYDCILSRNTNDRLVRFSTHLIISLLRYGCDSNVASNSIPIQSLKKKIDGIILRGKSFIYPGIISVAKLIKPAAESRVTMNRGLDSIRGRERCARLRLRLFRLFRYRSCPVNTIGRRKDHACSPAANAGFRGGGEKTYLASC